MKEKADDALSFAASALLSFCCTLPLALASLGLGSLGLGASVLKPWRPYMLAVGAAALLFGLFTVHRPGRSRANRILLWCAAALFAVVAATPYVVGWARGVYDPPPEIVLASDERADALAPQKGQSDLWVGFGSRAPDSGRRVPAL
jgi:hypothetical protein